MVSTEYILHLRCILHTAAMIISKDSFAKTIKFLEGFECLSLDTETTGLQLWKNDYLISIAIATHEDSYYFNFWEKPAKDKSIPPEEYVLPREDIKRVGHLLMDPAKTVFMHNAKFDMAALYKEGVFIHSIIHDTEVGARLERNDHLSYKLSDCASRIGKQKSDAVEEYIKKNHCYEWATQKGKKTRVKNKQYYLVPFNILSEYAQIDARITYDLGIHQLEVIKEVEAIQRKFKSTIRKVFTLEKEITKVAFKMEKHGVKVDEAYCEQAINFEDARARECEKKFLEATKFQLKDSNKHLALVFAAMGHRIPQTLKGNPSFTDDILEHIDNEPAKIVREYRDAMKRANTYFRSFLFHRDETNTIHPNLRQAGTVTTRFACKEPNLQNLTKEEEVDAHFPVRRAFVPREDFVFVMIDYDQMEFRMMLDYAGEMELIEKIKNGLDPHQATADMTGLTRSAAKTLNFGLLYGMGVEKLSRALKCPLTQAKNFKYKYFDALPKVKNFIYDATARAKQTGFITSWCGMRYHFPDPEFAYKAPNALIQGGCASVVKTAMIGLDRFLSGFKSRMLMQIHDEILFEIHKSEINLVPQLKKIMEEAYPYKHICLTASPSYSLKSWGDKIEGDISEARDTLQDESAQAIRSFTDRIGWENMVSKDTASLPSGNTGLSYVCKG